MSIPETFSLDWVDDFWKTCGPLALLRPEDGVLILPPNRVYRVNPTAQRILQWLQDGNRAEDFPGLDDTRRLQVDEFFRNIALAVSNKTHHATRIPYTFDYNKLPILGEIAVTYRCNNRCRFLLCGMRWGLWAPR